MNLPKHIHIIGICGVATSAIAIAFHKKGVKVTGSDKGFFPPVSTELEKHRIKFYAGWHPDLMLQGGKPDLVMIGGTGTSPMNPEHVVAKQESIAILSYAEVIRKYFIKDNSIVVAGTWGKTTTSALLSYVLKQNNFDPSYFTGGLSLSHDTGEISDSRWSVVEGDEYQVSISDRRPKFAYYSPTHLILTAVSWDHADLYPAEDDYFRTFERLVSEVPQTGLIVANARDPGVKKVTPFVKAKVRTYGKDNCDYVFGNVRPSQSGIDFEITHDNNAYQIHSPMLGSYNAENITASFAMAHQIGIPPEKIIAAISAFRGIKRRFEKRLEGSITVLDCHAPTPEKAASALSGIREVYKKRVIAVFEPNIGGRERESQNKYDNAFRDADMVFIPRLTRLKTSEDESGSPIEGEELRSIIKKTQERTEYVEDDTDLVAKITSVAGAGDVIVFLGSHGFRGMIEEAVARLR